MSKRRSSESEEDKKQLKKSKAKDKTDDGDFKKWFYKFYTYELDDNHIYTIETLEEFEADLKIDKAQCLKDGKDIEEYGYTQAQNLLYYEKLEGILTAKKEKMRLIQQSDYNIPTFLKILTKVLDVNDEFYDKIKKAAKTRSMIADCHEFSKIVSRIINEK